MSASEIHVLGQVLRPLEPVTRCGELLGLSRGQSFRQAQVWPTTGDDRPGTRRVVVSALLDQLGIDYRVISDAHGCQMGDSGQKGDAESCSCAGQSPNTPECPRDCVSLIGESGARDADSF